MSTTGNCHAFATPGDLREHIERCALLELGRQWTALSDFEKARVLCRVARDLALVRDASDACPDSSPDKAVYWIASEYLLGQLLRQTLLNLQLTREMVEAVAALGDDFDRLAALESPIELGYGPAAEYSAGALECSATSGLPVIAYGLNYELGQFRQQLDFGTQLEQPRPWRINGSPWLIERPHEACFVPVFGRVEFAPGTDAPHPAWVEWQSVIAIPSDLPIAPYGGRNVGWLRLFAAQAPFEFAAPNASNEDYLRNIDEQFAWQRLSKALYPPGCESLRHEDRLLQCYLLSCAAVKDIVRRYRATGRPFVDFSKHVSIQLHDSRAAFAIPELMRVLVDEELLPWDSAWEIVAATFDTLLDSAQPEILERWPVRLLERLLPRHLMIIFEINQRFLDAVNNRWPGDLERLRVASFVEEGFEKQLRIERMMYCGSHRVSAVSPAALQSIRRRLSPVFEESWPGRFDAVLRGVNLRKWFVRLNPELTAAISERIGAEWIRDPQQLSALDAHTDDAALEEAFRATKAAHKARLAARVAEVTPIDLDRFMAFDVQAGWISEKNRALLHALYIIHTYLALVEDGVQPACPRLHLFAGKALPGDRTAKRIIKLIHDLAQVINHDIQAAGLIRVAFLSDYDSSLADIVIPGADIGEHLAAPGEEPADCANIVMALNGAVLVGSLGGTNDALYNSLGAATFFPFGPSVEESHARQADPLYRPRGLYEHNLYVRRLMDTLPSRRFAMAGDGNFNDIFESVLDGGDPSHCLRDLPSYFQAQQSAAAALTDPVAWARAAIHALARLGRFSSDQTVAEFQRATWNPTATPQP